MMLYVASCTHMAIAGVKGLKHWCAEVNIVCYPGAATVSISLHNTRIDITISVPLSASNTAICQLLGRLIYNDGGLGYSDCCSFRSSVYGRDQLLW